MVMQVIDGAGWPIWLLIFTSIAGLSIILERAWFLREESVIPKILLSTSKAMVHKKHIEIEEIKKLCDKNYLGEIFSTILENQKSDAAVITAIVEQKAINIRYQLEKHLSYLTTVATVAPLLGLFGTTQPSNGLSRMTVLLSEPRLLMRRLWPTPGPSSTISVVPTRGGVVSVSPMSMCRASCPNNNPMHHMTEAAHYVVRSVCRQESGMRSEQAIDQRDKTQQLRNG